MGSSKADKAAATAALDVVVGHAMIISINIKQLMAILKQAPLPHMHKADMEMLLQHLNSHTDLYDALVNDSEPVSVKIAVEAREIGIDEGVDLGLAPIGEVPD